MRGEREPDGLQLVICDLERIVEEDHQPVACEVLERPFVGRDEVADHSVVLAEDVEQLFGGGRLGEGGEAAQIAEETRDVGPVPGQESFTFIARDQLCNLRRDEASELRPLPLDRLHQARVRDRDRGLVGEGLDESMCWEVNGSGSRRRQRRRR